MPDHQPALVLFDGICNFCNHAVQFILNRDPQGHFHFASLQSGLGQSTLKEYGLDGMNQESMVLIQKGKAFTQSTAALRIAAGLSLPWSLWAVFLVVPAILRDPLYRLIAKRRYRLFGKRETCMLPKPEWRHRFPENGP